MICVKCKKRPAIVFVQKMDGSSGTEGYCLRCAREMGIKPVDNLMKQMGISDEQMDAIEERMDAMFEDGEFDPQQMMQGMGMMDFMPQDEDADEDEEASGTSATLPFGFLNKRKEQNEQASDKKDPKAKEKGKKRKFLDQYCENLTEKARAGKLDRIVGRDREIYRTIQFCPAAKKTTPV